MADLSYDVAVNTTAAERNLTRLQTSVGGINTAFLRFKQTIATISLGAVISQALQYADAISDLSDASGIAVGNILGFSAAVQANGGSAEGAQKAILKLVNAIGDAADGSEETQKQFKAVGVSLSDLRTLSEQEILAKTIAGLDKITDNGKRSIAVTALLGKEFRNVAAGGLAKAYEDATVQGAKYADAITKGAAAQQNIDKTLTDFKTGLLEAIKPLTELISKVNIGVENFQKFVQALLAIGAAFLAFTIIGRIAKLFVVLFEGAVALFGILRNLGSFLGQLAAGWRALYSATEGAGGAFVRIFLSIKAVAVVLKDILGPAFTVIGSVAGPVLLALAGYWGSIQDSTGAAIDKLKEYLNYLPGVNFDVGGGGGRGDGQAEMAQRKKDADAVIAKAKELREVRDKAAEREQDRYRKLQAALTEQQQTYSQLNSEAQTFSNYLSSDVKFQTSLLGMTEDQKEIATALNSETSRYLQQQNQLQSKLSDVQSQIGIEMKAQKSLKDDELAASRDKVSLLVEEEDKLKALSKTYLNLHLTNGQAIEDELKKQQQIKNTEAERVSNLEYIGDRLKEQAASYDSLGSALRSINDKRVSIGFETNQQVKGPLARQFAEIQESARTAALEAGRAFAATFESEDGLTAERAEELASGLNAIAEGYRGIATAQTEVLTNSQTFASGLAETFAAYAESANNAASQAKTYFDTFTGGMEDALVKFVQTGKLSFKDLANSLIADLIRIQTRKIITGLFGGASGGGGIFGSLFGMSAGGPTDMSPMIVGERGPELFVPGSAGRIVPNNAMGGQQTTQNLTTVNYNIQAVDASSFRALVARDPQFIYSVTEKGRRSQPTRSR